ncbi:hypothetical protein [Solwaraspora sp. WMMA2101]|uniref:hypothetical protein n=1 Tax=Solwaraspora sp. WMMA2101 TaxID=3404124 RepID=UPI003B933C8D
MAAVSLVAGVALIAAGIGVGGPTGPAVPDAAPAPVTVARTTPDSGDGTPEQTSYASAVQLTGYDPAAGTAVLTPDDRIEAAPVDIRPGDVIASPPTAAAPYGALFTVDEVEEVDERIEVSFGEATLSDALGVAEVRETVEADDIDITVTPLVAGVESATVVDDPTTGDSGDQPSTDPPATSPATSQAPTDSAPTGPAPTDGAPIGPDQTPGGDPAPADPPEPSTPTPTPTSGPVGPDPATATPGSGEASQPDPPAGQTPPAPPVPATDQSTDIVVDVPTLPPGQVFSPVRTEDGGLMLVMDIPLPGVPGITGVDSATPVLKGWVGFTPELIFSYGRKNVDGQRPYQAEVGVGGTYRYGWQVQAKLDGLTDTGKQALRLPFAEVRLNHTLWIGPVPVVLTVELTYFYRLTAAGDLSIDAVQSTVGEVALGAAYDSRTGWKTLNRHESTTQGNLVPAIAGRGDFRATIGADLTVLLYDAAGVTGQFAPYLRAAVDATVAPPQWGLYAGFDLTGALSLRLKIFGITILKADLALPPINGDWRIVGSDPPPTGPGDAAQLTG